MTALDCGAGPEVVPLCVGKIETAGGGGWFGYGIYENGRAEEKLIADILRENVFAEVHDERAHDGVTLARRFPGQRIDIRHQPVAEIVVRGEGFLRVWAIGPNFVLICGARAMRAEDRAERAELKPANVELAVCGIIGIRGYEAADVRGPVGETGNGVVEAGGNLTAEGFPIGI